MITRSTRLAAAVLMFACAGAFMPACSREVSHTESDHTTLLGDQKHTEDTTYKNPDGSLSHEHQETTVK